MEVSESIWTRYKDKARRAFTGNGRGMTDLEYRLKSELEDARTEIARLRADLLDERTRNAVLESNVKISNNEVEKLAEVIERDRRRVEAETAILGRKIADAQNPQ